MNIDNDGECASNTPIGAKIDKIKRKIGEGKLRLLDNDGNPLVPTGIMESDSELELVFDETTNLRIPTSGKDGSDKGYGTKKLCPGAWYTHYSSSSPPSLVCLLRAILLRAVGSIADIKSALTERALQIFCQTYHIPDELSVIGAAKVSHFEVLCRVHGFEPTVGLNGFLFVHRTVDPTKVRIGERQHGEDEPKLLDTTVGRTVPLLPVAPARAESELDASVDRLFDEGGSGTQAGQGDSAGGGGDEQDIVLFSWLLQLLLLLLRIYSVTAKRLKKRKNHCFCVLAIFHIHAKKLREDMKLCSSHHSGANIAEAEADSFIRPSVPLMTMTTTVTFVVDPTTTAKDKLVESSIFGDGSSSRADHTVGGFSGLTGSDFIVGDDGRTCREMVDEFAPPRFFASIRRMEHDQLFTEFNVGTARWNGYLTKRRKTKQKATKPDTGWKSV
ncbi:hypothetical protein Tco_1504824 [Tanacetum coccineum]